MRKLFKKILTFGLVATMTLSSFVPVSASNKDFLSYSGVDKYKTKESSATYGIITFFLEQTNDIQSNFIAGIYENWDEYPVGKTRGEKRTLKIGYTGSYAFMRRGKLKLLHHYNITREVDQRLGEINSHCKKVYTKADKIYHFSYKKKINTYTIDISKVKKSRVYVNIDDLVTPIKQGWIKQLQVKKRNSQTIVFNMISGGTIFIPVTKVVNGKAENVIWNCPKADKVVWYNTKGKMTVLAPMSKTYLKRSGYGVLACHHLVETVGVWHY